ncbi:MAG: 4Fe-4S dicluster domain-containing protein [Armatimonadetes bacterium]|nr:4Fe-4S dicluster domain-containing protein [Armatimonadota bacterium]
MEAQDKAPINRRQFFLEGFSSFKDLAVDLLSIQFSLAQEGRLRPPGALEETAFLAVCTRCGKCVDACSYRAIKLVDAENGFAFRTPIISPRETPCYLCLECIPACPDGALLPLPKEKVRMGTAQLDRDACLAWQGHYCQTCVNRCPLSGSALVLEDLRNPVVNSEQCVGCGVCEYVCLTYPPAIRVKPQ